MEFNANLDIKGTGSNDGDLHVEAVEESHLNLDADGDLNGDISNEENLNTLTEINTEIQEESNFNLTSDDVNKCEEESNKNLSDEEDKKSTAENSVNDDCKHEEEEEEEEEDDDDQDSNTEKIPIQVTTNEECKTKAQITSSKPKAKKQSFCSKLCSGGKMKSNKTPGRTTISLSKAEKSFTRKITAANGFLKAIFCNIYNPEIYNVTPDNFMIEYSEIENILNNSETLIFDKEEYNKTFNENTNTILGHLKTDSNVEIGIKYNKKLMLIATWKGNKGESTFLQCYDDIMNNRAK